MRFDEAWKLSQIPYQELVFKSFIKSRGFSYLSKTSNSNSKISNEKLLKKVIQSANRNKIAISLIIATASSLSFIQFGYQHTELTFLIATSLSLLMIFGYVILYEIQFLPSILDEQPTDVLNSLPLLNKDVSYILTLSFVRAMDYIMIAAIVTPATIIFFITHSFAAFFVEMTGAIVSLLLGTGLAIYLSKIFYRTLSYGKKSKLNSVTRLLFIIIWGALVMSLGFLYNYNTYLSPALEYILTEGNKTSILLLSSIPSFSFAFLLSYVLGNKFSFVSYISIIFSILYLSISLAIGIWSFNTISSLGDKKQYTHEEIPRDFKLVLRKRLFAYSLKDFRIASRNPTTAFLVAAPVLETLIVLFPLITSNILGTITTLVSTVIGGIFACFVVMGLLTAEGNGLEYTKTLPVNMNTIMYSKALTATISYIPIPVIFLLLAILKPFLFGSISLIPLWELPAVTSATLAEMIIIMKASGEGKVLTFSITSGILYFFIAFFVSGLLLYLPLGLYTIIDLILRQEAVAQTILVSVSLLELAIMLTVSKNIKD
ncbi:MAG: hypothetical protein QXX17_00800 [Conexivisphaerales archaeon]